MQMHFIVYLAGSKHPSRIQSLEDITTDRLTTIYPLKKIYFVDGLNNIVYFQRKGKFLITYQHSMYLTVCGKKRYKTL